MNGCDCMATCLPIRTIYRFRFTAGVDMVEANEALQLAVLAVESLRGPSEVRLDAMRVADDEERIVAIDGSFGAGRDIAKIFVAVCRWEFGDDAMRVDRIVSRGEFVSTAIGSAA